MDGWYYLQNDEQKGPLTEADLALLFTTNQLAPETYVWREGMESWAYATEVPAFSLSEVPAPSLPPLPPIPEPAPVATHEAPAHPTTPHCAACQSPEIVPGYALALCQPCREKMIRFPVPLWLKISAACLVILVIVAATRIPRELEAAIACERGKADNSKGDYVAAEGEYRKALSDYPHSIDVLCGLADAAYRAGDMETARETLKQLVTEVGPDGKVSPEVLNVVREIKGGS